MEPRTPEAAERQGRSARRRGVAMRIVRRLHMYLGLLLFPWILLFGLSGMLFNHPHVGRDIEARGLSAAEVARTTGFGGWSPQHAAEDITTRLNLLLQEEGEAARYRLDSTMEPTFHGFTLFAAPARDGGRHTLILDLEAGRVGLGKRAPAPAAPSSPLSGRTIPDTPYAIDTLSPRLASLLPGLGVEASGPLRPHPEVHPELRFVLADSQGARWNVAYDLSTRTLASQPAGGMELPLVELLEKLHTQHHFPTHPGMTLFWALFADLTGLTLVLWALTGLAMWWQMKPTRVLGSLAVALALAMAAVVMVGTARELTFLPPEPSGP